MFLKYHIKEKEGRRNKRRHQKRNSSSKDKRWVVEREQIHDGITSSENYLQDMKRR